MRFPHYVLPLATFLFLFTFPVGRSFAGGPPSESEGWIPSVVNGNEVFVPLSPFMVSPAQVRQVELAPRGKYALVVWEEKQLLTVSGDPPGATSLSLYNSRTNRVRTIIGQDAQIDRDTGNEYQGQVTQLVWLSGSDTALAITSFRAASIKQGEVAPPPTYSLLYIDSPRGTSKTLVTGNDPLRISPSPDFAGALLVTHIGNAGSNSQFQTVSERGVLSKPLPIKPVAHFTGNWTPDGLSAVIYDPSLFDPQRTKREFLGVDIRNGQITTVTLPAFTSTLNASPIDPLQIEQSHTKVNSGSASQNTKPLWLKSSDPSAPRNPIFLTASAEQYYLLPDMSAVLFQSEGALYAKPIRRIPKKEFDAIQQASYRACTLQNAYTVAQALQQLSETSSGEFPSRGENIKQLLSPYINDPSALNLDYTFTGGKVTPEDAGKTILGYVNGAGGKVTIYADGRVELAKH